MARIALFHSALGVRPGITDAATRLERAGHDVTVVDQYDGRVFDDYDESGRYVDTIGFPALMQRALDATAGIPDGFVAMGFSNGGGMATWVALNRRVSRVVLASGALPLATIGAERWPEGVPAQLHYTVDDPRRVPGSVDSVLAAIGAAGAEAEFVQQPGAGHLFTDPTLPDEYDPAAAERFWAHVIRFLDDDGHAGTVEA